MLLTYLFIYLFILVATCLGPRPRVGTKGRGLDASIHRFRDSRQRMEVSKGDLFIKGNPKAIERNKFQVRTGLSEPATCKYVPSIGLVGNHGTQWQPGPRTARCCGAGMSDPFSQKGVTLARKMLTIFN